MDPRANRPLVIVTGAQGLIGTALAHRLARVWCVVGLDVVGAREGWAGEAAYACDLTDDESVREAFARIRAEHGARPASIVHLAAFYDFSGEENPLYEKLTVQGTRRVLEQARALEAEQFLFTSSLLVMQPIDDEGAAQGRVLTEDDPTCAEWAYPASKVKAEAVLRREHGDVPVVILRLAGIYDDDCDSIPIAQQIHRIHERTLESFFFPGDPTHGQSFLHLQDAVSAMERAIQGRGHLGGLETFLVGEPQVLSYERLQEQLGRLIHGEAWPSIRIPAPVAKAGAWVKARLGDEAAQFIKPWMVDLADAHYPVSIDRIRDRLGWAPRRSLEQSLPAMVQCLQRDPEAWYERHDLPAPESAKSAPGDARRP